MKKEIIAIAFSDLHINIWNKFNENGERTLNHFRVLSAIWSLCIRYKVPALFCGDMFHKPENIDNELLDRIVKTFPELEGIKCYAISGNHDMSRTNTIDKPSTSWVKSLSKVYGWLDCIDYSKVVLKNGTVVYGVPYLDHNKGLSEYVSKIELDKSKKNILLLHTDYPGAKDNDGREIGSVENLNLNTLNRFDLVLCGHIHKPQRLSKKTYMIGSPLQMRRTDRGSELGYWKVYSDMSVKFCPFDKFPKFIDVEDEADIKDDFNYYTVIPPKQETTKSTTTKIHKNLSKNQLARQYLRENNIKDKDRCNLLKRILKEAEDD